RTALVNEKFSMLIDAKQLTNEGAVAAIIATLDNSSFSEGFSYRELGLMGVDPDTSQEGLYLYDNAGSECEYLDTRANGAVIYERLKLLIKTQATDNITFDASGNPLYIGVDDPVSGNTGTFTQAEERTDLQSGETLAVLLGKVKKWFSSLGSAAFTESSTYAAAVHATQHAAGGSDPVTPVAIGAAPVVHTHDNRYFTKEESLSAATASATGGSETVSQAILYNAAVGADLQIKKKEFSTFELIQRGLI
ncbi:MAG: hypothetical protein VB071_05050, partial [Lawsonibacter sp.]|nr:hypothetical protein [Lawsonibacter sp.]